MSKLEQAKQKLGFIGRTLENGYLDFDTIDELQHAVCSVKRLITEHEQDTLQLPLIEGASTLVVYEPREA
ncbi:MAG TPA: hypothetical protein VF717_09290 [Pyrinomonadaceae bacterium]|jgi:methyl coenzyme M reductase beta subunit